MNSIVSPLIAFLFAEAASATWAVYLQTPTPQVGPGLGRVIRDHSATRADAAPHVLCSSMRSTPRQDS